MVRLLLALALVAGALPARADEVTLQNDVYGAVPNAADCQPGFVRNEAFASIFVPEDETGMYPMALRRVMVQVVNPPEASLEGEGATSGEVRLYVWHDLGIGAQPGEELLHRELTLDAGQREEIDLLADGLSIDEGYYRIGFEFLYDPTDGGLGTFMDPCPGIDGSRGLLGNPDNTIVAERNLIAAAGGGVGSFNWGFSEDFGVTQNWIVRAVVDVPGGGGDGDADADADADADSDADGDGDGDGDADADCDRATDCPAGNRCIEHQCVPTTCAVPADCGNGYDCVSEHCRQFCATADECPDGQICDEDGYCDEPPVDDPDKAGCACTMSPQEHPLSGEGRGEGSLLASSLVALALLLTRRKSA